MHQHEAVEKLKDALDAMYEQLQREGVPWAATIADAATVAAMKAQAECRQRED